MENRRGMMIAIASGKGGVGKTWFSVSLAHALVKSGQKTLVFDGDLGLANVDIQLGLNPEHDLASVLSGRASIEVAATHHPQAGFDVLAGRSGSGALSTLDDEAVVKVMAALREASSHWDTIILDLGAGLDKTIRRMSAMADMLVVLATDEPTSLTDAYAVVKVYMLDNPGGDVRLIINQAHDVASGEKTYSALKTACLRFLKKDVPLMGIVRRDPKVRDAIRNQAPFLLRHPNTMAAQDIESVALRIRGANA